MFDIGFSELIVVGIVVLIVVGPERLPKVARTAGLLLGRLQRYVGDVKADIGREIELEELKNLQSEVKKSVRDFERGLADEVKTIEQSVGQTVDSIKTDLQLPAPSDNPTAAKPAAKPATKPATKPAAKLADAPVSGGDASPTANKE